MTKETKTATNSTETCFICGFDPSIDGNSIGLSRSIPQLGFIELCGLCWVECLRHGFPTAHEDRLLDHLDAKQLRHPTRLYNGRFKVADGTLGYPQD